MHYLTIVCICAFILRGNYASNKLLANALVLDAKVEYQRRPWVSVKITKTTNSIGTDNFNFSFLIHKNIRNAKVHMHIQPLPPKILEDGQSLNLTAFDDACDFIKENYFKIFTTGNFQQICKPNKNFIRKGCYEFNYDINGAKLLARKRLGTSIYRFNVEHAGGSLLRIRLLVDTDILAVKPADLLPGEA